MKIRDYLRCRDFLVALDKAQMRLWVSIYVPICSNPKVTMLKEQISDLHPLAQCDVVEQPTITDTLMISDDKRLQAS